MTKGKMPKGAYAALLAAYSRWRKRWFGKDPGPKPAPAPKPAPTPKPTPAPKPAQPITMYDSVTPGAIPMTAKAVAGYVGGNWPNYSKLVVEFPNAHHLSIAISASEDAMCLDCEKGDATIEQAAAWVKKQVARGIKLPVVYTSVADAQALLTALEKAGVKRSDVRLWTAHYTGKAHRCQPGCYPGFKSMADATQWTDKALNRNLDASECSPSFFG